ncbi:MAG: M6 family metalloprotease domain-containing protein [Fibrobacter sp.]|nr:M6 family metalloprotease domain-containing protein [Fibrobacter sp.]
MKSVVTFFALFAVLALVNGALAAPFNPVPQKIDNGGDSLTVIVAGDERFSYVTTPAGELLVQGDDNLYYYADENGLPTAVKARDEAPKSKKARQLRPSVDRSRQMDAYRKLHPARVMPQDTAKAERAPWVPTRKDKSGSAKHSLLKMRPPNGHEKGENRFPVFLVEFSGQKNQDSVSVYNRLNKEGDTKGGYVGSVRDYFRDQSMGVFKPNFDLYFVTLNVDLANYINKEADFIKKAIEAVLQKYPGFDAKRYDSNNDGYVDMLSVLYAGKDFRANNTSFGGFHYQLKYARNVGEQNAGNGKKFDRYLIISQETYLFAVFLHEYSHGLGLKDHYCVHSDACNQDFTNSSNAAPGAHYWDVMATGMYTNSGISPPGYSAFERNFMGWLDYNELENSSDITVIPPLNTTNVAYKVSVKGNEDEWFVLENRQLSRWDAKLPNHGMLVWHIDYDDDAWFDDTMNDDPAHQRVDVVEAGTNRVPNYSAGFKVNYFTDDPFPGSSKVTQLDKFPTWGSSISFGLYSIVEKDSVVCFATSKDVRVDNCAYSAVSSSSAAPGSSSSGVRPHSSSSEAREPSSSSIAKSSSSRHRSSSSSYNVSSSSGPAVAAFVSGVGSCSLHIAGGKLRIEAPVEGEKLLQVFDLQGNLLEKDRFAGASAEFNLARFGGGARIVRVTGAGVSMVRSIYIH